LIELQQSVNGFAIAFSREIQQFATLIHFFFFGMRCGTALHDCPSFPPPIGVSGFGRSDKRGVLYRYPKP
jgi:hypothetical protein